MQSFEECAWQAIAPPGLVVNVVNLSGSHVFTLSAGECPTPIVLINGLGDSTLTWAAFLPELARSCRVIAYDRPGMGASPPIEGWRSLERMATEVCDLLASLEGSPAVLVGHSLGGLIAVEAYRLRPELIAGLVLVDSTDPALLSKRGLVALQRFSIWLPRGLAAVGLWRRIARSVAGKQVAHDARDSSWNEALAEGLLENLLSDSSQRTSSAELVGLMKDVANGLNEVSGGPIQVPLVVLSATKGGTSKKMRAAWTSNHGLLASRSSEGRHLEIEGGHYLHREQPVAVIHEVLELLQGVRRR